MKTTIGKSCVLVNGRAFKPADWSDSGLPIVRIQNLNNPLKTFNYYDGEVNDKFKINNGELLFSWSGTPGTSFGAFFWSRGEAILNQHIFKVIVDENKIYKKYYKYALNSKIGEIIENAHGGVGLKHITKARLESVEIYLPSLSKQEYIADILEKSEKILESRKEIIRLFDTFLNAKFLDMFGNPETNPKNFPVGCIRDLVSSVNYGSSEKASEDCEGYPMLRMGNITYQGYWDFQDLKYIKLDERAKEKYLVKKGDLLFNRTNSKELVGKTAVFDSDTEMAFAGYLIRVRSNDLGNNYYLSGYLNSTHGKNTLINICKSIVGMANINAQELQNIKILIPPKNLQDRYEEIYKTVRKKVALHAESKLELEKLFNTLSKNFFN